MTYLEIVANQLQVIETLQQTHQQSQQVAVATAQAVLAKLSARNMRDGTIYSNLLTIINKYEEMYEIY